MTFCVENETDVSFDFNEEEIITKVAKTTLSMLQCPYEVEVNILITDSEGIRTYNREYREIDKETDVLSFPAVDYEKPGDFSLVEGHEFEYINPDSEELFLGDIMLCTERIFSQAKEYGHGVLREFAFLIAHSMLHLLGYDHMSKEEETEMFELQEKILEELGITRD